MNEHTRPGEPQQAATAYQFNRALTDANVPAELRERNQWVGWVYEQREGKLTKPPRDPKAEPRYGAGRGASTTEPTTWGTYEEACEAVERGDAIGIGFVFRADDPYCGFDFDKVLKQHAITDIEGRITIEIPRIITTAQEAIDLLRPYGYAELSPSGTGLHIILNGSLPRLQAKPKKFPGGWAVEAYSTERYFTVTGEKWGSR